MPRLAALLAAGVLMHGVGAQEEGVPEPPHLEMGVPLEAEITEIDPVIHTETLLRIYTDAPVRGKTYPVQVPGSGPCSVDLRSDYFDAYLVLRDAQGNVLAEDDDGLFSTHARIVHALEGGTDYRVEVCALHGGTGPFEIAFTAGFPEELSPIERSRRSLEDARQAVHRVGAVRGPDHPSVATSLNNLAELLRAQGYFDEARPLYERSLGIREKSLGPDHPEVATSLNNLAALFLEEGQFDEARPLLERSLGIWEKSLGPDHPSVALSLNNLAELLSAQGQFEEARPLHERSLGIKEKSLGPDHPSVALSLNNLAELLSAQGQLEEARPLYERSLRILEKSLGPDHPSVGTSLNNLAKLLSAQGQFEEARPLYERSLGIYEKSLGPDHPSVGTSLNNLAGLLSSLGQFEEARPLYERSLRIREKSLGPDHADVAASLNGLASLLAGQGQFEEARPLYERSLGIREKSLGPEHPDVALSLNNLAELLRAQGRFEAARPLLERSLVIHEKTLGPDHPSVALSLHNLAVLLEAEGQFAEARPLLERSLEIREKSLGPDHPDVAFSLNSLAAFLHAQGRFSEARPLFERSLGIWETSLGPDHPYVATSLNNLACLEANAGQGRRAFELTRRALVSREAQLESTFFSQTESERLRFAATLRKDFEVYLSLSGGPSRQEGPEEVVSAILAWKGKVARSLLGDGKRRVATLPPAERAMVEELRRVQTSLSDALYARKVADRGAHGRLLEGLRARRKELELSLVRSRRERNGKGAKERGKEAAALCSVLPQGSVAASFLVHRVYRPAEWKGEKLVRKGGWNPCRVSAFVVRAGRSDVSWLDLGEARVLEKATKAFLEELVTRRGVDPREAAPLIPASNRLRELLWEPLRGVVGDAELVILSPDTFLGTLPFETLQENDGSFLIERRSFVYLQDLLGLLEDEPRGEDVSARLLVAGAIDYTRRGKLESDESEVPLVARRETRGGYPVHWKRLEFSGREVGAIAGMFEEVTGDEGPAATLLLRQEATEEAIKRGLERHTHVHLATHGYFQPEGLPSAWKNAQREMEDDRGLALLEETERAITGLLPGLLSGLVFAGANAEPEPGRDNGLLTAEEVTYLDLSRCDLVVLSACETGLGRSEGGEGMIGLRRSFRQAGARTVISSLWKVGDDPTQELMERFYENLWLRKMGKLEALRQAQLWMLERNREESGDALPSTWGAFVLDGDWE